jgi:PPE-repeat protein
VVAANRTRLMQLLATNWFGINLPAIAETEQEYQMMWANNSAAMSRYQATSQQATSQMSQFSSPSATTNSTGLAAQNAAVSSAQGSAVSRVSNAAVQPLAAPAADPTNPVNFGLTDPTTGYFGLANQYANQFLSSGFPFNMLSYAAQSTQAQAFQGLGDIGKGLSEGESALSASLTNAIKGIGAGGAPTGALGVGVTVGKLTMPPAVVGLLPAAQTPVQLAAATSPLPAAGTGFPMMPPLMPPPISPGSGWRKRKPQQYDDIEMGAEVKGKVIRPPPSAG